MFYSHPGNFEIVLSGWFEKHDFSVIQNYFVEINWYVYSWWMLLRIFLITGDDVIVHNLCNLRYVDQSLIYLYTFSLIRRLIVVFPGEIVFTTSNATKDG